MCETLEMLQKPKHIHTSFLGGVLFYTPHTHIPSPRMGKLCSKNRNIKPVEWHVVTVRRQQGRNDEKSFSSCKDWQ